MKIHNQIVILLILVIGWMLTACSLQKNESSQQPASAIQWSDLRITPPDDGKFCWNTSIFGKTPAWDKIKQNFQNGLVVGMSETDIAEAHEMGYQTFGVPSSQPITANYHLWYPKGNAQPTTIRFFVLMDEKQLPNVFDTGRNNDVLVNPGDDLTIKLHLPALGVGIHDFILMGIPHVNDYPTPEGIVQFISYRITLIAGTPDTSFRPISFSYLPAAGLISKNDPTISLSLILEKNVLIAWNAPENWLRIAPNKSTPFFILAGYEDTTNVDAKNLSKLDTSFFALLSFIDYQQVDISHEKSVVYAKVNQDTAYASIPAEIAPLPLGKHPILFLRINSPGIPQCLLQNTTEGRILPFSMSGSLVGIDVIEK